MEIKACILQADNWPIIPGERSNEPTLVTNIIRLVRDNSSQLGRDLI